MTPTLWIVSSARVRFLSSADSLGIVNSLSLSLARGGLWVAVHAGVKRNKALPKIVQLACEHLWQRASTGGKSRH